MISVMHLKILGKTDWGAGRLSRVFDKGFGSKSCVSKVTHWLFIIYLEWAERIRGILCDEVLVESGIKSIGGGLGLRFGIGKLASQVCWW